MNSILELIVAAKPGDTAGTLTAGEKSYPCAIGRNGLTSGKQEGDGGTPVGTFKLRQLFYRPDRLNKPETRLPLRALTPTDGWCDAPGDAHYNEQVALPYSASAETMWREDDLYDLCCVIGYNDAPVEDGKGSAIFLHLMREKDGEIKPTEGCMALRKADLEAVLALCAPETSLTVKAL